MFVLMWFCWGSSSLAFLRDRPFDAHDVSTWNQGSGGFPENDKITLGRSDKTIHRAGCGYYSASYMLVKTGALNPLRQSPIDVVKLSNSLNNTDMGTDWHFGYKNIGYFDPDLECSGYYIDISGMSLSEQLAYVKGKYYDGNFVIICLVADGVTRGHYIFVDGYDGDDMVIGDSGFTGIRWSTTYGNAPTRMKYLMLFTSKSGKKPANLPSIYSDDVLKNTGTIGSGGDSGGNNGGNDGNSGGLTKEEKEAYIRVVNEWELPGMTRTDTFTAPACDVVFGDSLNVTEEDTIATIKDTKESSTEDRFIGGLYVVVDIIGLGLVLYGVLFLAAFAVDRSNTVFDVSVIAVITLGRCRLWDCEGEIGTKKVVDGVTYLSAVGVGIRVVVLELVGAFLISGIVPWLVSRMVHMIVG